MHLRSAEHRVFCGIVRGEITPGVLAYVDEHVAVFPSRLQRPRIGRGPLTDWRASLKVRTTRR